jgi:hypothetical protein
LYTKVIYLSFLDISNSYILYISHLSVVFGDFYFLHFIHENHLSFALDISISHVLYTKVIYLSFLDISISYILSTKVIYLLFFDISISYILYTKVIYLSI